jgi:hypothetical protein
LVRFARQRQQELPVVHPRFPQLHSVDHDLPNLPTQPHGRNAGHNVECYSGSVITHTP